MNQETFNYLKERSMEQLGCGNNLHRGWTKDEIKAMILTGDAECYVYGDRVMVKVYYTYSDGKRYYAAAC